MCSSGIVVGRIVSHLYDEKPCCLDMGCMGASCCCLTIPVHFGSPLGIVVFILSIFVRLVNVIVHFWLGGMSMFVCLSYWLREKVIRKYNVEETETCCCGPFNPYCEFFHIHCNFPCSFFQMYVSILEWERQVTVVVPSTIIIAPLLSDVHSHMHAVQPSPSTPVAVPRDAAPATRIYPDNHPNMTPVRAVAVNGQNSVQIAVPVATPVGVIHYNN